METGGNQQDQFLDYSLSTMRELKMLGRIHTEEFRESYDMARQAGFDNINIDPISAIPGQTVKAGTHPSYWWQNYIRTYSAYSPDH